MSNRGTGVDYASNPEYFTIGAALGLGVDISAADPEAPLPGAAPSLNGMLGLNLGVFGVPRATISLNGFHRTISYESFDATLTSGGAHFTWKFFGPIDDDDGEGDGGGGDGVVGSAIGAVDTVGDAVDRGIPSEILFEWGGLDLTSGVEFSTTSFTLTEPITTDIPLLEDVDTTFTGEGVFDATLTNYSIPVELTTNFRFLYALSLYFGFGVDFQEGTADVDINIAGDLEGSAFGETTDLGTAEVEVLDSAGPTIGRARVIAGVTSGTSGF